MMASLAKTMTTPVSATTSSTFVKKDGKWEVEKAYNSIVA